jgi:hypothetical protein
MDEPTTDERGASRIKIGELPDLRIVAMDAILLHEEPDPRRRDAIEDRLRSERVLKHPPIVADPGDGRFVVLDGANRVTAMRNLGIKHIPVQVVRLDDPNLEIRSWHHAVERLDRSFFLRALGTNGGMEVLGAHVWIGTGAAANSAADSLGGSLRAILNGHVCAVTFPAGDSIAVNSAASVFGRVSALERITRLYRDRPVFDRVSYTNLDDLRSHYPGFTALVSFRPFRRDEIMEVVRAGRVLPAGLTRIILPKRALGIDMPLDLLEQPVALERKNRSLRELIQRKVEERSIRFYEEPTFRFDE